MWTGIAVGCCMVVAFFILIIVCKRIEWKYDSDGRDGYDTYIEQKP